jgi:hypothetical protein
MLSACSSLPRHMPRRPRFQREPGAEKRAVLFDPAQVSARFSSFSFFPSLGPGRPTPGRRSKTSERVLPDTARKARMIAAEYSE